MTWAPAAHHVDPVHRICWNDDEGFIAGSEISLAKEVNRFIDSVGQQQLRVGDPEKFGDCCFDRAGARDNGRDPRRSGNAAGVREREENIRLCFR